MIALKYPRIAAMLVILAVVFSYIGYNGIRHWWDGRSLAHVKAQNVALQAQVASLTKALQGAKATERVVTQYVDRVQVVAGRTKTIIKEVPIYVPADSPSLPPGFRVLHDAAATGELPDPARIADAAPVPAQDAAETIVSNYGTCAETAEQVIALQDWIRAQQGVK